MLLRRVFLCLRETEKPPQKISQEARKRAILVSSVLGIRLGLGYTPLPPPPLKALTGAGFARGGVQNLERLGVRSQNLDFKELTGFFLTPARTAHALTMICPFACG